MCPISLIDNTLEITGFILIIMVGSAVLSNAMAGLLIPYKLAQWLGGLPITPLAVLVGVCLMYLILGCFVEGIAIMLMTLPITFPLITGLGYDPIWYGVIVVLLIDIGVITPPVGTSLYIIQGIRGKGSLNEVIIGTIPFLVAMIVIVVLVIAFPPLATWLPGQMITR